MIRVNVREAREKLSKLLTEAEKGETVSITRHGQVVAQLVPPPPQHGGRFPDLTEFRKSITPGSTPARASQSSTPSSTPGTPSAAKLIRQMRDEERF